jgi:hypothetical protein
MAEEEKTNETKPEPAAETAMPAEQHEQKPGPETAGESRLSRFKVWYVDRKKWTIPLSVLIFILLLAGIPWTRYNSVGLVHKRNLEVKVVDSAGGTPVSGATVSIGSLSAETNGTGVATLTGVKVGHHKFTISKKYYQSQTVDILAPILSQKTVPSIHLNATGRQVKVSVRNLINKNALSDVDISVAGISAKTDKNGSATIVLPVGTAEQKAKLSLNGFNDADVTVKVSNDKVQENDFNLTPSGKVYFLSKLSGKIDVVKTNLDGTDRQTVLAGTGKEDDSGTVLLASRDWKYLALLSRRAGDSASLYLIDTSDDNLSNIDNGSASFSLVGWSDDNFIYSVTRTGIQAWQPHAQALKSFNAASKQLLTLDQTNAQGSSQSDYAQEAYGQVYEIGKTIVYEKQWNAPYYNQAVLNDKTAGIYSIGATGSNSQTLKTFGYAAGQNTFINSIPYEANSIYYSVTEKDSNTYWAYANGKVTSKNNIADKFNEYYQNRTTYLLSPSGDNTFWAEPRDGKNTLFIGDDSGDNGKQIASLSDYSTYGWYTDGYLLASKNSSELYIMPKGGGSAIKITDYHKPAISFPGYGGGYGGL